MVKYGSLCIPGETLGIDVGHLKGPLYMKKAALEARIAELNEKAEKQKSEIKNDFLQLEEAVKPKNIAKRAAFRVVSKFRSIFHFRKKQFSAKV